MSKELECQHCGEVSIPKHEMEKGHVGLCCDCYEMFELKLGLDPFECDPVALARVQEKARLAKERTGVELP